MPEALGDPVLLVYAALTIVPGLALAAAAGLRGWLLAALAPLLTYGLVGAAAPVLPMLGILWSPTSFAVLVAITAVVALVLWLVVRRLRPPREPAPLPVWTPLHHVGVAIGVVLRRPSGSRWRGERPAGSRPCRRSGTRCSTPTPPGSSPRPAARTPRHWRPSARGRSRLLLPERLPRAGRAWSVVLTGADVPTVLDASTAVAPGLLALGMAAMVRRLGGRPCAGGRRGDAVGRVHRLPLRPAAVGHAAAVHRGGGAAAGVPGRGRDRAGRHRRPARGAGAARHRRHRAARAAPQRRGDRGAAGGGAGGGPVGAPPAADGRPARRRDHGRRRGGARAARCSRRRSQPRPDLPTTGRPTPVPHRCSGSCCSSRTPSSSRSGGWWR